MNLLRGILFLSGFFFVFVAALGVLRLPDFYTRIHASGKAETFGMMLFLLGAILCEGATMTSLKIFLILVFVLLANPVGTHIIGRAAYRAGLKPWTGEGNQ
ncbi:MAG: monovalent cation/H(+) antiporter subunit G [Clostridia bacterium]|nr:monovalent cation/H(+) antiporter subunit G [Clostridia bacterium]